jgi:putative transcriptional regulator
MIRFRIKELLADKEFNEGRRITWDEVATATGVHRTTLSKLANQRGYNTTTEILDKLCQYFGVDIGDIAQRVAD